MDNSFYIILFVVGINFQFCLGAPSCIDETGNPVDWYVLYKLPKVKHHSDPRVAGGVAYIFITSETVQKGWQLSKTTIASKTSMPARTLSFIFSSEKRNDLDDYFWIFYNDQPFGEPYDQKDGHTKGIVAGNHKEGLWIVHSVPRFPVFNSTYKYPKTGTMYGQSFLCISMNQSNLDTVGEQLIINDADVYNSSFTTSLKSTYPALVKAAKKDRSTEKKRKIILHSIGNTPFISFAKSNKFGGDLYCDWVAAVLREELFVETWLHTDKIPSACNKTYRVYNIKDISINFLGCKFGNDKDHSKYVVSAPSNGSNWVCIGDINRASSQFIRGGGTVCLENKDLWSAYYKVIADVELCPK